MSAFWFWMAIAGSGALHGLNPASGWLFAAAGPGGSRQVARRLLPLALGHIAALGLAAAASTYGPMPGGKLLQGTACLLLLPAVAAHLHPRCHAQMRIPAGCIGLALWPLAVSGLPVWMPLCGGAGTLAYALAAVLLHAAAMLASAGAAACLACHGKRLVRHLYGTGKNTSLPAPSGQP
ncbi:hypothetical protein [Herbaspirillum sp.]|uniref:hypothetical protein n=1 Tax=Herbaspirillum sp. TaxID=1890675 RepID=UPI0031D3E10D